MKYNQVISFLVTILSGFCLVPAICLTKDNIFMKEYALYLCLLSVVSTRNELSFPPLGT